MEIFKSKNLLLSRTNNTIEKNGSVAFLNTEWWNLRIQSPHVTDVRESKTVLESGFHAVDSGFQALDSSLCQWNLDSSP